MSHQMISFIKSGFRIFGYFLLTRSSDFPSERGWLETVAAVLIFSEVIGIVEELGEK